MPEVHPYDNEDARRDLAVEMMKQQARKARPGVNYDADLEYLDAALLAFADEWAAKDLATALEQLAKRKGGRDAMIEIHEQEASA